jgi:hypothetical protein
MSDPVLGTDSTEGRMSVVDGANEDADAAQRLFVVRVMKTGSSTLLRQVQRNFPPAQVFPADGVDVKPGDIRGGLSIPYLLSLPSERRAEIRVYIGHFPYIAYQMLGVACVTATILRDPIARAVSHLKHAKRRQPMFRDFAIDAIYEDPLAFGSLLHNYQAKYFAMTPSDPLEGVMDIIDIDDRRLSLAKTNLEQIDVLGLTEHYGEFLEELRMRLGWSVPTRSATNVSTERWEPSAALRRRIEADNAADIEFYEYALALHEKRQRARS